MKVSLFFIWQFLVLTYIFCQDEESFFKKAKVYACIALSKARLAQDEVFISNLGESINQHLKIQDGKNKILSLSLVNCYRNIKQEQAIEIITSTQSQKKINSLTAENKKILALEETGSGGASISQEDFVNDFKEMNAILQELGQNHDKFQSEMEKKNKEERSEPKESSFIRDYLDFVMQIGKAILGIFSSFTKFFAMEGFFQMAFFIIIVFILLKLLKNLLAPNKPKRVDSKRKEESQEDQKENSDKKTE